MNSLSENHEIASAAHVLCAGGLVAFPTETVYGLGADAKNPEAVAKIFALKGRPADHPLIVHIPGADYMENWAREIPPLAYELAEMFWPGPLTLILKRHPDVPDCVTGGQDTVGLRVPGHPVALELLRTYAQTSPPGHSGLAAPSANRFGRISPTTAEHVLADLGAHAPMVIDGGPCPVGIESTILDLTGDVPRILRHGGLRAEMLAQVIGSLPEDAHENSPRTAGTLAAHYAPGTPLKLVTEALLPQAIDQALLQIGANQRLAVLTQRPARTRVLAQPHANLVWLCAPEDATDYAHDLYANLRALDAVGCAQILVTIPADTTSYQAVIDRLTRAAHGSGA